MRTETIVVYGSGTVTCKVGEEISRLKCGVEGSPSECNAQCRHLVIRPAQGLIKCRLEVGGWVMSADTVVNLYKGAKSLPDGGEDE